MKKETFGERLARLRKEKGLTQDDIANKIGISPQAVSKWENDISSPDIAIIVSLAEILGVSTDVLLGREEEKKDEGIHINAEVVDDDQKIKANAHISGGVHLKDDDGSEVHIDSTGIHINSSDGNVDLSLDNIEKQKKRSKFKTFEEAFGGALWALAVLAFIMLGVFWTQDGIGWRTGWLVFFLPIIISSLIGAIARKKFCHFAYPVLIVFIYLSIGMYAGGWHPFWFLFLTIPAYYSIFGPIDHYIQRK